MNAQRIGWSKNLYIMDLITSEHRLSDTTDSCKKATKNTGSWSSQWKVRIISYHIQLHKYSNTVEPNLRDHLTSKLLHNSGVPKDLQTLGIGTGGTLGKIRETWPYGFTPLGSFTVYLGKTIGTTRHTQRSFSRRQLPMWSDPSPVSGCTSLTLAKRTYQIRWY